MTARLTARLDGRNIIPEVENVVSTLAHQGLAERHEAYEAEIRRLLDAALTVMQRDGTIDPRVSDIVQEAGLSNQAFYRHFRGKDALLLALLEDGRERLVTTIERRLAGAHSPAAHLQAWIEAVFAQAQDPVAAEATRPFVINGDRLAVEYPDAVRRSRDRLVEPLRAIVGDASADAVYHLTMGSVQDALVERRVPSRRDVQAVVDFARKGAGLGA